MTQLERIIDDLCHTIGSTFTIIFETNDGYILTPEKLNTVKDSETKKILKKLYKDGIDSLYYSHGLNVIMYDVVSQEDHTDVIIYLNNDLQDVIEFYEIQLKWEELINENKL